MQVDHGHIGEAHLRPHHRRILAGQRCRQQAEREAVAGKREGQRLQVQQPAQGMSHPRLGICCRFPVVHRFRRGSEPSRHRSTVVAKPGVTSAVRLCQFLNHSNSDAIHPGDDLRGFLRLQFGAGEDTLHRPPQP